MKTKKLFHIQIASLIAIGALALVGFTQTVGKNSISRLQNDPLNLDVPSLNNPVVHPVVRQ